MAIKLNKEILNSMDDREKVSLFNRICNFPIGFEVSQKEVIAEGILDILNLEGLID